MLRGGKLAAVAGGGAPGWVLRTLYGFPTFDIDFVGNRAWSQVSGLMLPSSVLSCSRNSAELAQWADGHWSSFPANTLAITDLGLQMYGQGTNYFLNSAAPATQTITIASTGSYTITAWGTNGSVVVAAGTAVGTGFGTATASVNGGSVTINISVVGTIVCTVTGSPLYVNVENGAFKTPPIVTTGVSATRYADVIQLAGPALAAALNAKSILMQAAGSVGGSNPRLFSLDKAGPTETEAVYLSGNTQVSTTSSPFPATLGSGTIAGPLKVSAGFGSAGRSLRANGGAIASDATPQDTSGTAFYIGNRPAGDRAYNGPIKRATFGQASTQMFMDTTAP